MSSTVRASTRRREASVRVTPTLASTIAERLPRALASCARDPRARGDVADDVVRRLKWTKEKRRSSPSQSCEHVSPIETGKGRDVFFRRVIFADRRGRMKKVVFSGRNTTVRSSEEGLEGGATSYVD